LSRLVVQPVTKTDLLRSLHDDAKVIRERFHDRSEVSRTGKEYSTMSQVNNPLDPTRTSQETLALEAHLRKLREDRAQRAFCRAQEVLAGVHQPSRQDHRFPTAWSRRIKKNPEYRTGHGPTKDIRGIRRSALRVPGNGGCQVPLTPARRGFKIRRQAFKKRTIERLLVQPLRTSLHVPDCCRGLHTG
jgi:hypothetical protein